LNESRRRPHHDSIISNESTSNFLDGANPNVSGFVQNELSIRNPLAQMGSPINYAVDIELIDTENSSQQTASSSSSSKK
jgi:hypothetical protein